MEKREPFSITRQSIYAVIPMLDLYAAYRVQRLRRYILIAIGFTILSIHVQYALIPKSFSDIGYDGFSDPVYLVYAIDGTSASLALSIYLIRRWSHQWNAKFTSA